MTTTNERLTPAQIHQLNILASREHQTIADYLHSSKKMKASLEAMIEEAHGLLDAGSPERAEQMIMKIVREVYNFHGSVRTASNTYRLHALFIEVTGNYPKARSLFYPHLLTAEDKLALDEQARMRAIAYEDAQSLMRSKRHGSKRKAVQETAVQEEVLAC